MGAITAIVSLAVVYRFLFGTGIGAKEFLGVGSTIVSAWAAPVVADKLDLVSRSERDDYWPGLIVVFCSIWLVPVLGLIAAFTVAAVRNALGRPTGG